MTASRHADKNLADARTTRQRISNLDRMLHDFVITARNNGASWQQVAEALGTTKQAAWERYGK